MKKMKYIVTIVMMLVLSACELLSGYRIPSDMSGYKGRDAQSVVEEFQEAGFIDVQTKVIYDLPLEKKEEVGLVTSITINDSKEFEKDELISIDSKVVVTYHDLQKHKVNIHVNFEGNWFFYKYDVKLVVDDQNSNTLTHGENADLEYELKEGEYTLKFIDVEDKSISGQTNLVVNGDVEASYTIHCYADQVAVKEDYVNQENPLEENQVKMTCDVYSFVGIDYKEVMALFENSGFTNVKSEAVYDIKYGVTLEESCADVTIDGSDSFKAGDIFEKDVPVIVYYHMKEEDEKKEASYSKAIKCSYQDYDVYYLFDETEQVVYTFKTDEEGVIQGTFSGTFEEGVEMTFNNNGNIWKEKVIITDKKVVLTDARNYSYDDFEEVDVKEAQEEMEKRIAK